MHKLSNNQSSKSNYYSKSSIKSIIAIKFISVFGHMFSLINFYGFWHFARLIGKIADKNDVAQVRVGKNSLFNFNSSDPYWNRIASKKYQYEPEIYHFFIQVSKIERLVFLDCGSNYGYWSILASDKIIDISDIVAIEASKRNYFYLDINNKTNGCRFKTLNMAISNQDDQVLYFSEDEINHANSKIVEKKIGSVPTRTVSIDKLSEKYEHSRPILVKLDVEGAEVSALIGAETTLSRDCCIVFEDHGNDPTCIVTDWIMKNTSYVVFWKDNSSGNYVQIISIEQLRNLKKSSVVGYNLFATRENSAFYNIFT